MPHKDPDARRAYMRQYKANRREHMRTLNKESYERHREEIAIRRADQRAQIPDEERKARGRMYCRTYRERNPEKIKARLKAWLAANPEKSAQFQAAYKKNHPEMWRLIKRAAGRRRDAKIRGARIEPRVSYKAILDRDGYICHICKSAVEPNDVHVDHIIPLSKGGAHSMSNIAVAHSACNLAKRDKILS